MISSDLIFSPHQAALTALEYLNAQGYAAYLVGGCVRDAYLGRTPGDYDIATSALPHQIKTALASFQTLDTGLVHGTVTALVQGMSIEITTFRKDGAYSDGRRPDQVTFSRSLREDLARRDFTCNAMAWHPREGLQDPFGGGEDCDRNLLRTVGQPRERFREDALRILRALRFCCQLGFQIEEESLVSIRDCASGLSRVAAERVAAEINKSLIGEYAAAALGRYPEILFMALPELEPMLHPPQKTSLHPIDVWEHSLFALSKTPADTALRWAVLFHQSGKPHCVAINEDGTAHFRGYQQKSVQLIARALSRLKQPRALLEECAQLVRHHVERVGMDNLKVWINRLGYETTLKLLRLQQAIMAAQTDKTDQQEPPFDALYEKTLRLRQSGACVDIKGLAVNGNDLLALGIPPGPRIGQMLNTLLGMVLTDEIPNRKDRLLEKAKSLLSLA